MQDFEKIWNLVRDKLKMIMANTAPIRIINAKQNLQTFASLH